MVFSRVVFWGSLVTRSREISVSRLKNCAALPARSAWRARSAPADRADMDTHAATTRDAAIREQPSERGISTSRTSASGEHGRRERREQQQVERGRVEGDVGPVLEGALDPVIFSLFTNQAVSGAPFGSERD